LELFFHIWNYGPTHITTGMIQEIIGPGIVRSTALALPALNQVSWYLMQHSTEVNGLEI